LIMARTQKLLPPVHPGEVLREEFMVPLGLSINRLARDLRVPVTRIAELHHERRAVTSDTALRLALYFGTTPDFWMNLQIRYDLEIAKRNIWAEIKKDIRPLAQTTR
jgi:addiction module HigA family antidote